MLRVVPVDAAFLWQAVGMQIDMPIKGYVGVDDGKIVGAGGLAWGRGKCWLWLEMLDLATTHPVHVIRWGKRMLRQAVQLGEDEVWTPRDEQHESSKKLLTLMGFTFSHADDFDGKVKEVWRWQV